MPDQQIPHPRTPPCTRHHVWMPNCPDCCAWHRDHLRAERENAQQRQQAERQATT